MLITRSLRGLWKMFEKTKYLTPEIDIIRLQIDGDDPINSSEPYIDDPGSEFPVVTFPGQN